jgi:fibrillarin-like pre-rRNA processing protein
MKPLQQSGVHDMRGLIWTRNKVRGRKVYGEPLRPYQGREYRAWNPRRSKMAALIRKDPKTPWFDTRRDVLYLGASTGTTLSHISDLLQGDAKTVAVEFSPRSMRDLIWNMEGRENTVPVLDDAGQPSRYQAFIDRPVGAIIQDVAQRHQVDIFLRNLPFLAKDGRGFLFVKARSIDVARPVREVYADVEKRLLAEGVKIVRQVDLDPFEKDHRAFIVELPK